MEVSIKQGIQFNIDDNAIDNMELLDALSEVQDNNPLSISKVTTLLLGKEQKKKLYDFFRREDGTVPIKEVSEAVVEIMSSTKEGKK